MVVVTTTPGGHTRCFTRRLGCSTISFRHQPLPQALATIAGLGFAEIDLGALPGVCDHVPYVLDDAAVADVAATVAASGLRVRSINGDIGDLNAVSPPTAAPRATGTSTCSSRWPPPPARVPWCCRAARSTTNRSTRCRPTSTESPPNSSPPATFAADRGVELWTESLHFHRLCYDLDARTALAGRLPSRSAS